MKIAGTFELVVMPPTLGVVRLFLEETSSAVCRNTRARQSVRRSESRGVSYSAILNGRLLSTNAPCGRVRLLAAIGCVRVRCARQRGAEIDARVLRRRSQFSFFRLSLDFGPPPVCNRQITCCACALVAPGAELLPDTRVEVRLARKKRTRVVRLALNRQISRWREALAAGVR